MSQDPILALALIPVAIIFLVELPALIIWYRLVALGHQPGWSIFIPGYREYAQGTIAKKPNLAITTAFLDIFFIVTRAVPAEGIVAVVFAVLLLLYVILVLVQFGAFIKQYDAGVDQWMLFILLPIVGVFHVGKVRYIGDGRPPTVPLNPDLMRSNTNSL